MGSVVFVRSGLVSRTILARVRSTFALGKLHRSGVDRCERPFRAGSNICLTLAKRQQSPRCRSWSIAQLRSGLRNIKCSIVVLLVFRTKWPVHSRRSSSSTMASSVSARCFTATAFFPTYAIASSRSIDTTVAWVFSIP